MRAPRQLKCAPQPSSVHNNPDARTHFRHSQATSRPMRAQYALYRCPPGREKDTHEHGADLRLIFPVVQALLCVLQCQKTYFQYITCQCSSQRHPAEALGARRPTGAWRTHAMKTASHAAALAFLRTRARPNREALLSKPETTCATHKTIAPNPALQFPEAILPRARLPARHMPRPRARECQTL